jgi:cephalosporin hydroxylase
VTGVGDSPTVSIKRAGIGAARAVNRRFGVLDRLYEREGVRRTVRQLFQKELIDKTDDFADVRWLGHEVWQSVLDLWVTQEVISQVRPSLLVEAGTNRGGSALFYANLMDLMGRGEVVTVDIEKMHDLSHPRIEFLLGSSTDPAVVEQIRGRVVATEGPVMVILDSDHSEAHVHAEMEAYGGFVSPDSYMLVQDGIMDTLPAFADTPPGPLGAIERYLAEHSEFEPVEQLNERFLITHHPLGWLRRRP